MSTSSRDNYEVILSEESWIKMTTYVDLCPDEIAAFGYITPHEEGYMYVDELFLVPQEVSGAEVDFVTNGLPFAVQKAIKDDRVNDLRFCAHSHVNMGTTFSTTDEDMIDKIGRSGPIPWFVSAIFNKKGDTNCRIDLFDAGVPGLKHVRGISLDIYGEHHAELMDSCLDEIDELVKRKKKDHARRLPPVTGKNGTSKSAKDQQLNWWDDDAHEEAVVMLAEAKKHGWDYCVDSDGVAYFFNQKGDYEGSCQLGEDVLASIPN